MQWVLRVVFHLEWIFRDDPLLRDKGKPGNGVVLVPLRLIIPADATLCPFTYLNPSPSEPLPLPLIHWISTLSRMLSSPETSI